jgi:hypothetical protein
MVLLTAMACLVAILLRTPIRSRYWAWQVARSSSAGQRAMYVTLLCNAGDGGRWGTSALLEHPEAEVRQFGVLVLHHVHGDWARKRLLRLLRDPDEGVRELAALGLAIHGDEAVIRELKQMYLSSDHTAATTACVALGRIATPWAVAALTELAGQPADADRRAALADALDAIGTADCVPALLELLADERSCTPPGRAVRLALEALRGLQAERPASLPASLTLPDRLPVSETGPATVAEQAAAALKRITGLTPPFSLDLPDGQKQQARRQWAEWYAATADRP